MTLLTVAAAIRKGADALGASQTPALDARILMKCVLDADDAGLVARSADALPEAKAFAYNALIDRRRLGEPVAYIVGEKEFWSLPFKVSPDVLIPRSDSECLIEAAIARRERSQALRMLDLGVGSGCLLCALLSEFPNARGVGVDQSPAAVRMAHMNAKALGVVARADFAIGDWGKALHGGFDVIVANPPYIPEASRAALARDVAGFEPHSALFAGVDGLDAYWDILADAPRLLREDGLLLIEVGENQAAPVSAMVSKSFPGAEIEIINDLAGRTRGVLADCGSVQKKIENRAEKTIIRRGNVLNADSFDPRLDADNPK